MIAIEDNAAADPVDGSSIASASAAEKFLVASLKHINLHGFHSTTAPKTFYPAETLGVCPMALANPTHFTPTIDTKELTNASFIPPAFGMRFADDS